jgi:hypothetical protein
MELLVLVGVMGFLALLAGATLKPRADARLFALAKSLGGHVTGSNSIVGSCGEIRIGYALTTTGGGSSTEQWTEITADLPPAYPLAIYLRRQGWLDRAKISKGELVDVEVGDGAFDARFLVEAAPAAVIAKLLDDQARRFLMKLGDVTLTTQDTARGRQLVLAIRGWSDDPALAGRRVDEVARIARRVREVFDALHGEVPIEMVGAPFREMPLQRENPHTPDRQRAEVSRLEIQRASRIAQQRVLAFAMLGAIVFVIVLVIAAAR